MKLAWALLMLALVSPAAFGQTKQAPLRVAVTEFTQSGDHYKLRATIAGSTSTSQLVVLVRYAGLSGYRPAADGNEFPVLPKEESPLASKANAPPTSFPRSASYPAGGSAWVVEFQRPSRAPPIAEVYAVACDVRERKGWSREKDYSGFQYLPFDKTKTIDDALDVLRDFGWTPVGLTRVESKLLRRLPIRSAPVK